MEKKKLIILLPGNPGIIYAYDNFIQFLEEKIPDSKVYCHPHLGQRPSDSPLLDITLGDQLQHHKAFIEQKKSAYPDHDLYLVGHSLGGLLSAQIFRENIFPLKKVILICPFYKLCHPNIWVIKGLKRKRFHSFLKGTVKAVGKSPSPVQKVLQKTLGLKSFGDRIFSDFKKENFTHNFFSLLKNYPPYYEELDLSLWLKEGIDEKSKSKLFFIFAKRDLWAPKSVFKSIPKEIQKTYDKNLSHGFCLDTKQSNRVAEMIQKSLPIS